jgi:Flp pilus assembly protein protease CpaA
VFELELVPVGLALVAICIANYTDLFKGRIIPNKLTYPLIGIGVAFYVGLGLHRWDLWTLVSGGAGAAIAFAIGYAMWLTGGWAGGDVKLFTALGALIPMYQAPYVSPAYSTSYPFFPLTILFNSVIAIIPILLFYIAICRARKRGALYEQIRITELREGTIPAETIYEKNGKIGRWTSSWWSLKQRPDWDRTYTNPRLAAGVTRYQVGALKRLVREGKLKDRIRIKKGIPFAPALGAGLFIAVFYGDLYWRILMFLIGA